MKIIQLPLGPLQTNCYVLACTETSQAAVIDPSWSGRKIVDTINDYGWTISKILLTHSHFDHIGGLAEIKELSGAPILMHAGAVPMLHDRDLAGLGWSINFPDPPPPDQLVGDGDEIVVGSLLLTVIETPGHAPGHISFWLEQQQVLFDGDVLFQGSIGRPDLPGGDYEILISTIKDKLMSLPDDTTVLPGHGQATTIGREREWNPFL